MWAFCTQLCKVFDIPCVLHRHLMIVIVFKGDGNRLNWYGAAKETHLIYVRLMYAFIQSVF